MSCSDASALSVLLMFFPRPAVLQRPETPENTHGEPRRNPAQLRQGPHQPEIHDFSAYFFRLLDRLLAGVHHPAALRARLHQSAKANTDEMLSTGPLVVIAFTVAMSVDHKKMTAFRAVLLGTLIAMVAFAILAVHSTMSSRCTRPCRHRGRRTHSVSTVLRLHFEAGAGGAAGNVHGLCVFAAGHRVLRGRTHRRSALAPFRRSAAPSKTFLVGTHGNWVGNDAAVVDLRPGCETVGRKSSGGA